MTERSYRSRLERDLPRWQDRGWVTAEAAEAILASLGEQRAALRMSALVALLGTLLLGVGFIGVVAANWEAIPRIVRFWSLVATLAVSYGGAAMLHAGARTLFTEAALLLAGLVFAASIALVGQTYHLAGEFSDAVLMWTAGCLVAAFLTRSIALTVLATLGATFWTGLVGVEASMPPHLPSLAVALVVVALATWIGSSVVRKVALFGLGFWITVAVITAAETYDWMPGGPLALLAAIALAFWTLGMAVKAWGGNSPRLVTLGADLVFIALPGLLLALGFLQIAPKLDPSGAWKTWFALGMLALGIAGIGAAVAITAKAITWLDAAAAASLGAGSLLFALWVHADGVLPRTLGSVLVLTACLWTVSLGHRGIQLAGRSLGLTAFGLEIAYVYVRTFGTVLDTALALLGGGALFLLVAIALFQVDRRLSARNGVSPLGGTIS